MADLLPAIPATWWLGILGALGAGVGVWLLSRRGGGAEHAAEELERQAREHRERANERRETSESHEERADASEQEMRDALERARRGRGASGGPDSDERF